MKRAALAKEIEAILGRGEYALELESLALLFALLEEVRGLREDLSQWRSAQPNTSKSARQLEAEALVGQPLEAFFANHADSSIGVLAARLKVSRSTCHGWREQWGPK